MNVLEQTFALMKTALAKGDDAIAKTVSTATGLVAYDLQAPSKNLYPVNTPIRNRLPRVSGGVGTATNWKQITVINGSGYNASPWVAEGQRTARMTYTAVDKAASYKTLGEEDQVTFEATSAGRTFEDVQATATMRVLQKMMLKEEVALLGGNNSVSLAAPTAPTVSASGTGATLPAATYVVYAVALTLEGYLNSSLAGGVATTQTITGADGQTYPLNGGSSNKSGASSGQAVTLGQTLFASTPAISGAVAYAWYVGTAGNEKLEQITTINSAKFTAPLAGTGQAATAIVANNSVNALGFNGLLYSSIAGGGYFNALATGVSGTGTVLTASARGTINEIDVMLKSMWDLYQVSPTVIYVNSQELQNITNKALTGSGTAAAADLHGSAVGPAEHDGRRRGGLVLQPVRNERRCQDPDQDPSHAARRHDHRLVRKPAEQYQSNNTPNVAEVKTRVDYYQIDWPLRTRAREFGVYAEEVLAVYAPFAMGVLTNIANG
jgi:hypothetical protein